MHDVQPAAVVERRVLQLGGIHLAMAGRGGVEDLGERAEQVFVVVEVLVVVAAGAGVALREDLVATVHPTPGTQDRPDVLGGLLVVAELGEGLPDGAGVVVDTDRLGEEGDGSSFPCLSSLVSSAER